MKTAEEFLEEWWTSKDLPECGFNKTAMLDFAEQYAKERERETTIEFGIHISEMKEIYRPNPLEYFHGKVMELFHVHRINKTGDNLFAQINGKDMNDIIYRAKLATYIEYPEMNKFNQKKK